MKKIILTTAFVATNLLVSFTDVNAQKGFLLGIEGTPQTNWLVNQDDLDNSNIKMLPTYGGSFGLTGQYNFTNSLGIGLHALYSFQGQKFEYFGVERSKRVEYVKIPVLFAYSYEINPNWMFLGKIGPQLGILTNAKMVDKDGDDIVSDQTKAYMDADFGAMLSAGFGLKLNDNFSLDAALRYDAGFTDAEDKDFVTYINDPLFVPNGNPGTGISTNRSITNNMSLGITIGLRYIFSQKSSTM